MAGTDHRQLPNAAVPSPGGAALPRPRSEALAHADPLEPAVILVRPQLGENIGTAARAMLNCGLTDLRLVSPRDGWPNPAALASASGATAVLEAARVYSTTEDAIADLQWTWATTARPRDLVKPVQTPRAAGAEAQARRAQGQRLGFLFGAEKAGLTNDEVVLARTVVTVPLHPGFTSLNLAQAVLLMAYEYHVAGSTIDPTVLPTGDSAPAAAETMGYFFNRLEDRLEQAGFFTTPDLRGVMVRNLRTMFQRMSPTEQEVRTLHGVVSALCREFRRKPSEVPGDDQSPP